MLANKERILQKMEEFNLDAIIASHPENVSYLGDFQSHLPYMYRFLNVESYALFPRRADIAPCLIIASVDAAWAARFPLVGPGSLYLRESGICSLPTRDLERGGKEI